MEDLIRRADAIKAIDDKINGSDNRLWLREIISELPSADRPQEHKLVDAQRYLIDALNKKINALEEQNQVLKEVLFGKKGENDENVDVL